MILPLIFTLSLISCITAVPVARLLGCGIPDPQFPLEKHQFCCLHFRLNCDNFDSIEYISTLKDEIAHVRLPNNSADVLRKIENHGNLKMKPNLVRVRTLGESCRSSNVRCAVGLECRRGTCLRSRSLAHLQRLIKAGEKIEREEQAQPDDVPGTLPVDEGALLPERNGITLHGQSIVSGNEGEIKSSEVFSSTSQNSVEQFNLLKEEDKAASGIEEDEVTANVADFLESKGMKLGDKDWHSVRELIAGTIDERLERDDEVQNAEDAVEALTRPGCPDGSKWCKVSNRMPIMNLCPALP